MEPTENFLTSTADNDETQQNKESPQCFLGKAALWVRLSLQWALFKHGCFIQKRPFETLFLGTVLLGLSCTGLKSAVILTDIGRLWIPKGGRLQEENEFREKMVEQFNRKLQTKTISIRETSKSQSLVGTEDNFGAGGFQVLIQTPRRAGLNMLNKHDLMLHAKVMEEVAKLSVEMFGANWTMSDLCFKPPTPLVEIGHLFGLGEYLELLFEKMMPCILITPLDCFWDGAKPLGPHPPVVMPGIARAYMESLPDAELSWKNFDPVPVLAESNQIIQANLLLNTFERSGVGRGYLDRPCINPLDPECPKLAPNFLENFCDIAEKFVAWNQKQINKIFLKEKQNNNSNSEYYANYGGYSESEVNDKKLTNSSSDDSYYYYDEYSTKPSKSEICIKYEDSVRSFLNSDSTKMIDAFMSDLGIDKMTDFGSILTNGCPGVGKTYLHWPEPMILGGVEKKGSQLTKIEALQTVMILAGGVEVFSRYKDCKNRKICNKIKPSLDEGEWSVDSAHKVINAWQRKFVDFIYSHPSNKMEDSEHQRRVHPLSATSLEDMLRKFSKFKPVFLITSYILMLCYSGFCLFSAGNHGVSSCSGLAMFGVILVTFASVSGLGFATLLGSKFNAATTQIVPFLTLGLGVDDMFLLVHNYKDVASKFSQHELGYLLRKTGLSVLLTSINNVLAFLAGSLVPVPAMRDFCTQTAILLFFNVVAILTMYPAMMSVDLNRRKSRRIDIICCVRAPEEKPKTTTSSTVNGASSKAKDYTYSVGSINKLRFEDISLQNFVTKVYSPILQKSWFKVLVLLFFGIMLSGSIYGVCIEGQGLDLTDVVPKDTAPYSFLEARETYFSFFPMFSVLKGPIDYPRKQKIIEKFRDAMQLSNWTVASRGKLGQYWLGLFGSYLENLQMHYKSDVSAGKIRGANVSKTACFEGKLAYKLICNTGPGVNCSRNEKSVEMVDKDGLINTEGFYKYLTVWYNLDNTMYYVSQADFFPTPPHWVHHENKLDQEIPTAYAPLVSQIPFYLNGLVDTKETVKAIREIREIGESFSENELPNFPQGIPFTFWEQYFYLIRNLVTDLAIITSCVYVVISVLLMSPWAGAIVVSILLMMVAELCGFMGLVGLKLNPISAVSLITAVGIGVEFTVHMTLAFLKSEGSKNERVSRTLATMFVPVAHGGISTVLGIIVLAFSEFEFIVRYFFMVMAGLIVIGLLNGLILLPVVLSLIGPPTEVRLKVSKKSFFYTPDPNLESCQENLERSQETEVTLLEHTNNTPTVHEH